ncbi:DUF6708 domain-containing protein [Cupriavidus necator]|uniref:DUF6708 domain-containing protein n=1 Tax=Cupriavidus necator TaxID=106590 RepID=UPI0027873FB3|nr:DUF6708 domain-containing protein [Cupriavidus necator]MDQ0138753.1 hypothetical protein [Cupriavidus necator]
MTFIDSEMNVDPGMWLVMGIFVSSCMLAGSVLLGPRLATSGAPLGVLAVVFGVYLMTIFGPAIAVYRLVTRPLRPPVILSRKSRQIYVWRGIKLGWRTLNYDDVHPFIFRALVRDTFAVGMDGSTSRGAVLEHWEMVRRYMEEDPQSLPFPPLALTVSTETTLRNMVITQVGGQFSGLLSILMLPITLPWALFRYLAMKTCKRPIWPEYVENACAIDPHDPRILEKPSYAGNAKTGGPEGDERLLACSNWRTPKPNCRVDKQGRIFKDFYVRSRIRIRTRQAPIHRKKPAAIEHRRTASLARR